MAFYYDRQGNALADLIAFDDLLKDQEYKRVAYTEIGEVHVSTVWLGIDHAFGKGPPLIFETMVFGGSLNGEQARYSTEEQALAGHEQMVAKVQRSDGSGSVESGRAGEDAG